MVRLLFHKLVMRATNTYPSKCKCDQWHFTKRTAPFTKITNKTGLEKSQQKNRVPSYRGFIGAAETGFRIAGSFKGFRTWASKNVGSQSKHFFVFLTQFHNLIAFIVWDLHAFNLFHKGIWF